MIDPRLQGAGHVLDVRLRIREVGRYGPVLGRVDIELHFRAPGGEIIGRGDGRLGIVQGGDRGRGKADLPGELIEDLLIGPRRIECLDPAVLVVVGSEGRRGAARDILEHEPRRGRISGQEVGADHALGSRVGVAVANIFLQRLIVGYPEDDFPVEQAESQAVALVHAPGIRQEVQVEILGGGRRDEAVRMVEVERQAVEHLGEIGAGSTALVDSLEERRQIAERPGDILDSGGLAAVIPVVSRLPGVHVTVINVHAIVGEQDGSGRGLIAELRIDLVLTRAQRHDEGVVEEMALQHGSGRLDNLLGIEIAAAFVGRRQAHRGGFAVPEGGQRARRGAAPREVVDAVVVEVRRSVIDVVALSVADVIAEKAVGDALNRRGPRGHGLVAPIEARREPRLGVQHRLPEPVLPADLVFVFVVGGELLHPQPLEEVLFLGEIEFISELGAVGIPLLRNPQGGGFVRGDKRAQEIRVGRAVEQLLVGIDLQLARLAFGVGDAKQIALIALRIFPHERHLAHQQLAVGVEELLFELDVGGQRPVHEPVGCG